MRGKVIGAPPHVGSSSPPRQIAARGCLRHGFEYQPERVFTSVLFSPQARTGSAPRRRRALGGANLVQNHLIQIAMAHCDHRIVIVFGRVMGILIRAVLGCWVIGGFAQARGRHGVCRDHDFKRSARLCASGLI
jgi:hypothetical protein